MTVHEVLRERLLTAAGVLTPQNGPILHIPDLAQSEWSPKFERYMRNRLIMGAYRYGLLHDSGKPRYDRLASMKKRIALYERTGNDEILVDVANICLLEFEEGCHPHKHWGPIDDGEHTGVKEHA